MAKMANDVLERRIKKSEIKAKDIFGYECLCRKEDGLLACELKEEKEDIVFRFDIKDKKVFESLRDEEKENKLRFLQNVYRLKPLFALYNLSLDKNDIFYDSNFLPYVAMRDIREPGEQRNDSNFLEKYKEIAAGVLSNKYTYERIQTSGVGIVYNDKSTAFILGCATSEELCEKLRQRAENENIVNKKTKIRIDRKKYQYEKTIAISIILLLILAFVYTGYQTFFELPREKAVVHASRAYVMQDYVGCIDSLADVKIEQMDTYTKYILAVSYAKGEVLEKEELQNVISNISMYANEVELEYWIALGRSGYAQAEDMAKALSDDKLLIYAYMKEMNYLEANFQMNGEEKQNRLNELSNSITEIGKKYFEE